jgi:cellobiose phosphorylase
MESKNYGYFDQDGREYVVTDAKTPLPFVNYFWNNRFISGVSQHMAGIGCFTERPLQYMDPECRCLMVRDENRHFYMRDAASGLLWSSGWYPVLQELDEYRCRHGLGYSILESRWNGINTSLRVFVPSQEPVEIWSISISNEGQEARTIQ